MSRCLTSSRLLAGLACASVWLAAPEALPDTCSGLSLTALAPFGVGTGPTAVAAGDFNRDGRLDVAVLNEATNNVSIMLGNGSGGFVEASGSPVTTSGVDVPSEIVAGDLDMDGAVDLVVSSATTINAKVLKGQGNGTFSPQPQFPLGPLAQVSRGSRLYLGRFTGDADLDLIALDESGFRIRVYAGTAGVGFDNLNPTQDIDLSGAGETPSAGALLDFDRNGTLDLGVAMRSKDVVRVYLGDGAGKLNPGPSDGTGSEPADLAAGDVDRDGWTDLVTADFRGGTATTLRNAAGGSLKNDGSINVAQGPTRVALADLDHNGLVDLAVLDEPRAQVNAFSGEKTAPFFDPNAYTAPLPKPGPRGLVVGSFTDDGRDDFVTALHDDPRTAVVVDNRSGTPCVRASYAGAPRSYPAGSLGPLASGAADFDKDGRTDLVVATNSELRILRNANGGLSQSLLISPISPFVRAVAVADVNVDGNPDVVIAKGQAGVGQVQVYLGDGLGGLTAGVIQPAGIETSALVVADFTGDGAPDVAATSETLGQVFVFKGNGLGGLTSVATVSAGGSAPRAIVAADFNGDLKLDLAVALLGSDAVHVLGGNGNGTFTPGPTLAVGDMPLGLAAADLSGDGKPDLVSADNGSGQVSVLLNNGLGGFLPATAVAVGTNPTAVALLQLAGDPKPDIAVTTAATSGAHALSVLANNGTGGFSPPPPSSSYPVRISPQAITPIDVDTDGLLDLAVPCRSADAVVVLVQRPPVLSQAPRVGVADEPRAAVTGDFDGDGDLDVAVANGVGDRVVVLFGDGMGGLSVASAYGAAKAEAIVAGDFDRDGDLDLAVSAPGESPPALAVLLNSGAGAFVPQPLVSVAGWSPDELVAGDFDRDGLLDLAVCNKLTPVGRIEILRNSGGGAFSPAGSVPVGDKPTAIVSADFDQDGDLDLAVANELGAGSDVRILANTGGFSFAIAQTLALIGGDQNPVSLAAADFDGNGSIDLAAAALVIDRIHLYRNTPGTGFTAVTALDSPYILQSLSAGDLNLDGRPDLVALASGVSVFRGAGGLAFDTPQTVVAGHTPAAAVASDFDRDGRPDLVVVNQGSDDVSMLRSTACSPLALEVSLQPAGCSAGSPPYARDTAATAYDEGGNVATCASGSVTPAISPGTGDPTAVLGGPGVAGAPYVNGVATFSGGSFLTIDKPGRRYRLQLTGLGMAPVHTRSFTLGPTSQILGPSSVCPSSSGQYQTEGTPDFYDTYAWSLNPSGPAPYDVQPFAYSPTATLTNPPLTGSFQLSVAARVDQCVVSPPPVNVFFGALTSVTLQTTGASSVCVDCIGGSSKAIELGGGTITTRQWGYRTVSGTGAPISIPGEGGDVYVLKGANFPGPGTYFVVVTSTPTCGTPTVSSEWAVSVTASVPTGEVRHLAASSRGSAAGGQNQLRWVNTTGAAEEIRIRWDEAPAGTTSCVSPPNVLAPFDGEAVISTPAPSAKDGYLHSGPGVLLDTSYCYTVFVKVSGAYSPGRTIKARPFDATPGPQKWAYATGGSAVAPPTVSAPALLAMSNDRTVHALTRGGTGGDWPGPWMPADLLGVAHSRSPVVPFAPPLGGSNNVLFTVDDAIPGHLHAIDTNTGIPVWPAATQPLSTVGAPGGMFTQFTGIRDALFVGTRDNSVDNALRALSVSDGSLIEAYAPSVSPGPIGPINGSPAIDYATRRIYFASHKRLGGDTLFCLEIGAASPVFTYRWSRDLGNITGSPVLRGGRVIVGNDAGLVYSIEAISGLPGSDHSFSTGDGPVKGFVFPDRRNDDLIFATNTKVWSLSDDAATMTVNWTFAPPGLNPSVVLYWPLTNFVYVGSGNGELYQLDFTSATIATPPTSRLQILGGGQGQVGAPSLDIGVTPRLLIVGSEPGVVYGLTVPFP